jgi:hypothetical protein
MGRTVLLLSGGIGDFLHYLCRIPAFLAQNRCHPADLTVMVESSAPQRVAPLFKAAVPGLNVQFAPAPLHWTRSNPLLVPSSREEREHRPAYEYARGLDATTIVDWFLPLFCREYATDPAPLERIIAGRTPDPGLVIAAARDKGFRWWPSQDAARLIDASLPSQMRCVWLGTPEEQPTWLSRVETPLLIEGLRDSWAANLFVGTDTGLATIRELTGKKNIYCINEFWLANLMMRYGYFDDSTLATTHSRFVYDLNGLRRALTAHFEEAENNVKASVAASGRNMPAS